MKSLVRGCGVIAALLYLLPSALAGAVPVAGIAVPELTLLDTTMTNFMTANSIGAGQLSLMRNGVIIYHRSFGWKNQAKTNALPLDTVFRIASVSKPITAAAIRKLVSDGYFTVNTKVFSLGVAGAGLLDHVPFGTPDSRLKNVTVDHLLKHTGGWDRDIFGDVVFMPKTIASAMGTTSPPGRDNTVRWVMGKPLQHDPGTTYAYSNFGYLLLGLIIEKVSGQSYRDYVYQNILEPEGVPLNDFLMGRTFAVDQDPREPYYESPWTATNVYYPAFSSTQTVTWPYGGFDLENFVGFGGTVTNGITFLRYLNKYTVAGDDIGKPRWAPGNWWWWHSGSLDGTNTAAVERGDGFNYAILFDKRPDTDPDFASQMVTSMQSILDNNQITTWPGKGVLPPTLTAAAATNVASSSATLNGAANPEGTATSWWFEYGQDASYGTSTTHQSIGNGITKTTATVSLTALAQTAYHYRLAASNANGTSYGPDQTFTLAVAPQVSIDQMPALLLAKGQSLSLTTTATGTAPLHFQWRRNSAAIPGAINASYDVASVGTDHGGSYDCVVSNDGGTVTSDACAIGVVDTAGALSAHAEGTAFTLPVAAIGPGLTFAWLKDGMPVSNSGAITGASMATLRFTAFHAGDAGSYACRVTLGALSLETNVFTVTVFQKPSIQVPPASKLASLGESLALSVTATGDGTLKYQWRKNSVAIAGATSATYSPAATTALAGSYDCLVTNSAGSALSTAASVAVADFSGASLVVNEGATFTRSISSSVTGLTFLWSKAGGSLSNGGPVSGVGASKLTIGSFNAGNTGSYSCHVMFGALSRDTLPVMVAMRARPVVDPFAIPPLLVSASTSFTVTASSSPTKFTITGLPAGLTYNATTGVISGIPNAASAGFTLKISATNAAGTGPLYSVSATVQKLAGGLAGTWNGLIPPHDGLKMSYGGTLNIVPAATGTLTGAAVIGGVRYVLTGRLQAKADGTATLAMPIKRAAPLGALTLNGTLDSATGGMSFSITDGTLTSSTGSAYFNPWTVASQAKAYAGAYTAAIQVPGGLGNDSPKGTGYAFLTIGTTGTAAWTGKLADGSVLIFSSTISGRGDVPLQQMLYTNKGYAEGWCLITPDAAAPYATNKLDGSPEWEKDPQTLATVRTYKAGFARHQRTLIGGKYAKPAAGTLILGLPVQSTNNATLDFSEAGFACSQPLRITSTNTAAVPANANVVTLTLNATTGAINGGFTRKDPNPSNHALTISRSATYFGALVPRLSQGVGHFLLAQMPDPVGPPVTTLTTSPILSGQVVLH